MKARYPADWKLRSRFIRQYRAKNRCERCGAENGKPHPVTGARVILTCAHIYDDRPEACSLLNLQALCQKCHNGLDGKARAAGIRERREKAIGQLLFDLRPDATVCNHSSCFQTMAYVPAGEYCTKCNTLISQHFVPANEPELIGYVSANWAWHYRDGKDWTTQEDGQENGGGR